jgi:hypothetical protein
MVYILPHGSTASIRPWPPPCRSFTITLRHTTLNRTPLDEWSARRKDLYLTTHNTRKRHIPMPPLGFEPAIPASERPQNHALDRAVTGIWLLIQSNNVLLLIGLIFSAFLGPENHLQIFECPVALSSVIIENHISSKHQEFYVLLTANKSHNGNQIQRQMMWQKKIEYNFTYCAMEGGGCRNMGIFDTILNFKYFFQAVKFWWPTQNIPLPHNFPSFPCGPLETCCGPLGVYKANFETHYTIVRQFFLSEAWQIQSTSPFYFLKISFNIILSSMPRPSKWPISIRFFPLCITKSQKYRWSTPVRSIANHMPANFNKHNWTVCSAKKHQKVTWDGDG